MAERIAVGSIGVLVTLDVSDPFVALLLRERDLEIFPHDDSHQRYLRR
jgi:hypothetical protein